jgi:hypothetical protein
MFLQPFHRRYGRRAKLAFWLAIASLLILAPLVSLYAQSADTSQGITETQTITASQEVTTTTEISAEATPTEEAADEAEAAATAEPTAEATDETAEAEATATEEPPAETAAAQEAAPAETSAAEAAALADQVDAEVVPAQPVQQTVCVVGTVIDQNEQLIGDGRTVTVVLAGGTGGAPIETTVGADGSFRVDLTPDTWNFSIKLFNNEEGVTPTSFDVPLTAGQTDCYRVRFKIRRFVEVIVIKYDDAYTPQPNWTIYAEPGYGNVFATATSAVTDGGGTARFRLTPGQWIFTEQAPPGVTYTPIIPPNGRHELNVTLPGPHTIYFKNRINIYGCIEVRKVDRLPPQPNRPAEIPLGGWRIEVRRANGSVVEAKLTDANGAARFDNLPFGPYTVVEETRGGWEPVPPGTSSVGVTVAAGGQCVQVLFVNRQVPGQFCMAGRKIDTNGKVGLPGWTITAAPQDAGGYTPAPATTNGLGMYRFDFPANDYRIPGARYRVCEIEQAGWLPHTPICYTVTLPKQPGACVQVPDFENQQQGHGRTPGSKPNPDPAPGPGCSTTHIVQSGEGLYAIGARYGVSGRAMLAANPWVRNRPYYYLYVGDKLCIP